MTIDATALKAEIDADSESLISAELKAAGATTAIAAALNSPRANADPTVLDATTGLPTEFNVKSTMTGAELFSCVDFTERNAILDAGAKEWITAAIQMDQLDVNLNLINLVKTYFPTADGPTRTALQGKIYTPKSRAEMLWGASVTRADVVAALAL